MAGLAQVRHQPIAGHLAGLLAVLLAALAGACAGSPSPTSAPSPARTVVREAERPSARLTVSPRSVAGDAVIARVGGTEIRESDLGAFAIRYYRDQANEILTHLIDERIIDAEARRLGVTLPAGLLDREVDRELADRERTVKVEFGARATLTDYVRERYGVTLAEYRRDHERLIRTRLMRDRVIRLHEIRTDRVEVRDGVFPTQAAARAAADATRAGADLARIARETGARPEVVLPPVPRDEITPPELADDVFALAPGGVSAPIGVEEEGRTLWHVFKLVRRLPGRDVLYPAAAREIEDGLAARDVERFEYLQWARHMRDRYGTEILR